jgi:CBS domain-containing protein
MQLKDVMTNQVRTISTEATVQEAARKMDDENVGALPICDGGQLVGIVTDRDIVVRSISAGRDPSTTPIRDVMTAPVIYGLDEQSVEEAAEIMKRHPIRRLPVLDHAHRLVGMITADDLIGEAPHVSTADMMRTISEVERPGL